MLLYTCRTAGAYLHLHFLYNLKIPSRFDDRDRFRDKKVFKQALTPLSPNGYQWLLLPGRSLAQVPVEYLHIEDELRPIHRYDIEF